MISMKSFVHFLWPLMLLQCCTTPSGQSSDQPNILFILSDDHTSQAWGVYGGILADYVKNDNIKKASTRWCIAKKMFSVQIQSVYLVGHPY